MPIKIGSQTLKNLFVGTTKIGEVYVGTQLVYSSDNPIPNGQQQWTTPGTYSWTAPADVTAVSAVCVGGGGQNALSTQYAGSGGGGLGWKNSIPVVPGNSYTVVVGGPNGDSYFINDTTVCGRGGTDGSFATAGSGGSFVGDGGGAGGAGGKGAAGANDTTGGGGGGGAGGYSGNGGKGGDGQADPQSGENGASGTGGGGGGGGGTEAAGVTPADRPGGSGGGVGLLGQGANGAGGLGNFSEGQNGYGGSGGTREDGGGRYGGASGGWRNTSTPTGRGGAVRLIWGENRAFPSTNTGNL